MKRLLLSLAIVAAAIPCLAQSAALFIDKGLALQEEGLYEDALNAYREAEKGQATLLRNRRQQLYGGMATCLQQLGQYGDAIDYYRLQVRTLPARSPYIPNIMLNASDLLIETGQYDHAINLLMDNYPRALAQSGVDDNVKRIVNLATCYVRLGETGKALNLLDSVIATTPVETVAGAVARQNKGFVLYGENQLEEARQLLTEAQPYLVGDAQRYQSQGNLALVESALGNKERAMNLIDESIAWQRKHLGDTNADVTISLRKRAEILLSMPARRKEAVEAFKAFFNAGRRNIAANLAYMTEQQRQDYWNTQKELLAECYAVAKDDPDFGYDVALFSKNVLLQANINIGDIVRGNPRLKTLYDDILRQRHSKLTAEEGVTKFLDREIEQKEHELMRRVKAVRDFQNRLSVTRRDIMAALPNERDRAMEIIRYADGDTVRYAALMTGRTGHASLIPIMTEPRLDHWLLNGSAQCGTLGDATGSDRLADKDNIFTDTLLAESIWKPLLAKVPRGANVFFSPEGLFHLIAIEYMHTGRPDCSIYRLSSTRRLTERRRKAIRPAMLVVGGIDYDTMPETAEEESPDRTASCVLAADHQPPAEGGGYGFLKGSLSEADTITAIASRHARVTMLKASQVSEDKVKREMGKYDIVHVSTHGYSTFYQVAPPPVYMRDTQSEDLSLSRSGILLSGANALAPQTATNRHREDGVLSAMEASALDLSNVGLVVLSACQTGLGRVTADGVAGMPRGLKKAGAGAVIVSLWNVDDNATQMLMSHFYDNLAHGLGKHDALLKAQRQLRSTVTTQPKTTTAFSAATLSTRHTSKATRTTYDRPSLWAPFILIDEIPYQ